MNWKKNIIVFFLMVFFINICYPIIAKAETIPTKMEIRVGLTSMYSEKGSITIYNEKLGYGYCIRNTYKQEVLLTSTNGFTFNAIDGYFVRETKSYSSYQEAKIVADTYMENGIEAYVGSSYQQKWRVYFGNYATDSEAKQIVQTVKKQDKKISLEILSGNNYRVLVTGSFGKILLDVDENNAYPQFRPITSYQNGVKCIDMGDRVYRGRMEIGRYGKTTVTAVNILPMEEYLYSVVPAEMPATWHEEALKAQAVCARSYALVGAGYGGASNAKKGYNIVDTTASQVYKGFLGEDVKTKQAVDSTKGEMVYYNNKVISAYFFSTSGGSTEFAENVWGVKKAYLKSVPYFDESDAPKISWQKIMKKEEISALFLKKGIKIGYLSKMIPMQYSSSGRIDTMRVEGSDRFTILKGTKIRSILNLYSTKFKIVQKGDIPDTVTVLSSNGTLSKRISEMYVASASGVEKASSKVEQYIVQSEDNLWNYPRLAPTESTEILFAGMGYGHGIGMSQYGAKGMAEAGFTYKEIIEYYFTGAYVK